MLFCSIFLLSLSALSTSTDIYSISLDKLTSIASSGETEVLENVFAETGALVVTRLPADYVLAVKALRKKAPDCLESSSLPVFGLPDGSQRRTFALESHSQSDYPECIEEEARVINHHFDQLDTVMSAIILDVIGDFRKTEWSTNEDNRGSILSKIYKEHIHVYTNTEQKAEDYAVPFHTDNGILLFLTPDQSQPLVIRNRRGETIELSQVEDHSVIVLLGSALPEWLLKGTREASRFIPAPHAVPSLAQPSRTVFARMMVAPADAVPVSQPGQTFGGFFSSQAGGDEREDWDSLLARQCQEGSAYCWMACLTLPPGCTEDEAVCVNILEEPCCTDNVTEGCVDMDASCQWQCGYTQFI